MAFEVKGVSAGKLPIGKGIKDVFQDLAGLEHLCVVLPRHGDDSIHVGNNLGGNVCNVCVCVVCFVVCVVCVCVLCVLLCVLCVCVRMLSVCVCSVYVCCVCSVWVCCVCKCCVHVQMMCLSCL